MARILLVEDDAPLRGAMVEVLRGLGHHVTDVADVASAQKAMEPPAFDLVLSDYDLGLQTGIDLAQWMQGQERAKTIPFILHTNTPEWMIATDSPAYAQLKAQGAIRLRVEKGHISDVEQAVATVLEGVMAGSPPAGATARGVS